MDIAQLVSGIVSAAIAFGGVYLAAHLKRRDDRDLHKHQDDREFQRLVRERGERVFTTLDKVRLTAHQIILAESALLDGRYDASTYQVFGPRFPPELREEIDDIRFSLEVYLPGAVNAYIRWSEETNRALEVRSRAVSRALKGEIDRADIELYRNHAQLFTQYIDELCLIIVTLCRANDGAEVKRKSH